MNALTETRENNINLWDDQKKLEEIRKLFAPKLSDLEFQFFVGMGKATSLNPFMREIWSVKYQDNVPAQVFIGRDGYRKAAQAHSDYDFHQCDAVYENDSYEVNNGEVKHSYKLTNRGALIGAYCIAKRHKSSRPMYVFAEIKEYSTGKSLWNAQTGKPATMIKKVAESQCLRACFQDLLGGTYGEEEFNPKQDEHRTRDVIDGNTNTQKLKNLLRIGEKNDPQSNATVSYTDYREPIDAELDYVPESHGIQKTTGSTVVRDDKDRRDDLPISTERVNEIMELFAKKNFSPERIKKALHHHLVQDIHELDEKRAKELLSQLERSQ